MKYMSPLGRFSLRLATILISLIFLLKCTGNGHLFKALGNTYMKGRGGPSIDEYDIFYSRKVSTNGFIQIPEGVVYNGIEFNDTLMNKVKSYDPAAILIFRDEQIIYEKYFDDYYENSITNSFSVAKSIVALGIAVAVDKQIIPTLDEKVINYIPELEGEFREELTIRHLLSMTSGIDFDESYGNPFGFMARAYYGDDLLEKTLDYEVAERPGDHWKYLGGNTILLSVLLSRASGMTTSDFISEHIWKPLGTGASALWNLDDKGGIEKAYCCFYARPEDFGRIGMMVCADGFFHNKYIVSPKMLTEMKRPVVLNSGEVIDYYGLHWWLLEYKGNSITYARGILGQYIITIPEYNLTIVRLGHKRGEKDEHQHPVDLYYYIEMGLTYGNLLKNHGA